jgi:hypothetical protein
MRAAGATEAVGAFQRIKEGADVNVSWSQPEFEVPSGRLMELQTALTPLINILCKTDMISLGVARTLKFV